MSASHLSFHSSNATPPTQIYTLSLHDALPIFQAQTPVKVVETGRGENHVEPGANIVGFSAQLEGRAQLARRRHQRRSEEHTSELQSPCNLVCRLLLEKKKKKRTSTTPPNST